MKIISLEQQDSHNNVMPNISCPVAIPDNVYNQLSVAVFYFLNTIQDK